MIKCFITVFILSFSSTILAQDFSKAELDSMYNLFTYMKGVNISENFEQQLEEHPEMLKCGMGLVTSLKQNLNSYSLEQQNVLSKILDRPTNLPNTSVSLNGFFRVHFTTAGNNAIGYDINLLLAALDSVYNFEINYLGYPAPPSDGSAGDDDKYDIYIQNLGGLYGYTQFENKVADSRWTSYMVIDNDFVGYYSTGINGARVTVAHEFHHGIQSGSFAPQNFNSPYRNDDIFFYELTSTSMEEFVFDNVNDYYSYMHTYFQHPERAMPLHDGYNLAIWDIYLQKNFGFEILKNQWERIPTTPAIKAIALSIDNEGSTFGNELNKFGIWCYFTNTRAISGRYFEEAINYPLLTPTAAVNFSSSFQTYNMSLNPTANYFLKINLPAPDGEFNNIITNSDWQKTIDDYTQLLNFSFTIYADTASGEKIISENYSVSFSRDNQNFWNNAGILNNIVVYGDSNFNVPDIEEETFAYPTPFRKSSANNIYIVFQSDKLRGEEVDLNIYSAGLELQFANKKFIDYTYSKNSKKYCKIMLDKSDIDFSTGVYIYIIKSGDNIYKGKLVIFND
ncbi:MAG: MXAN_6640 family putative metalloprotease [Ignavibacteriota bacterium]